MRRTPVFFGWWVTLALSIMVFFSTSIRFTVGPFLKPIVADLGVDRASFSLVISLGLFLYGAFMPFVGRLADRVGARTVMAAGAVVMAVAEAATGLVQNLWQFAVTYGVLLALGLAASGHVIASAVVARWFDRRRATALGVLSGISMAGMSLFVPAVMWLILTVGWRATYGVLGLCVLVIVLPLALFVVRDSPASLGLCQDGDPAPRRPEGSVAAAGIDVGVATQTPPFWQLSGTMSTCGFTMSLLSAHGVPMLTDHGYHPMVASWAIGVLGATSIVATMAIGMLADRYGGRPMLAWIYAGRGAVLAAMFLIRDQPSALFAVAALGGTTMGGSFAMTSTMTAQIFGSRSLGAILGTIFLVHQTGSALGSWLGGFLFEQTGGYGSSFAIACVLSLISGAVCLTIDERPRVAARLQAVAGGR